MLEQLQNDIRQIVGADGILSGTDLDVRAGDWLGQTKCDAGAIVRPRSSDELAAVMALCNAANQPVVAAGGLTGLVHGADATPDTIQISFERMRNIMSIDPVGRTMVVEAGVPLQAAQEAAEEHGLIYAVDLGARGSATIGGTISTNAGGNQVLRYGMTRDNVLGIEAVLADGTVLSSLNRLLKNNAAYDLKQLFIGTEGTLGLVTKAVLRLHPKPRSVATALLAVNDFDALVKVFRNISDRLGPMLTSFEVMWQSHYRTIAVESGRHTPPLPGDYAYYIIVESSGMNPERDDAMFFEEMSALLEQGHVVDATIAASGAQRQAIWDIREDIEGIMHAVAPAAIFDVSLPISEMDNYITNLGAAVAAEWGDEAKFITFGHLGDGNLHIGIAPRPWTEENRHRAEELVYRPLAAIKGSVSAEHGIGLEKRAWLSISRTPEEIATMQVVKRALDPKGLLNPGKIFSPGT